MQGPASWLLMISRFCDFVSFTHLLHYFLCCSWGSLGSSMRSERRVRIPRKYAGISVLYGCGFPILRFYNLLKPPLLLWGVLLGVSWGFGRAEFPSWKLPHLRRPLLGALGGLLGFRKDPKKPAGPPWHAFGPPGAFFPEVIRLTRLSHSTHSLHSFTRLADSTHSLDALDSLD